MPKSIRWILFFGDSAVLYGSLALTLYLRSTETFAKAWELHIPPFTILFLIWLCVFFLADFYHHPSFTIDTSFFRRFSFALTLNIFLTIAFFYLVSLFGIAPKTNLALFATIFTLLFIAWRGMIGWWLQLEQAKTPVLFVNLDEKSSELIPTVFTEGSPFQFSGIVQESGTIICTPLSLTIYRDRTDIARLCESKKVGVIVIGEEPEGQTRRELYKQFIRDIRIYDAAGFAELLLRRIPVALVDADWLLREFRDRAGWQFSFIKRISEVIVSGLLLFIFFPILTLIYCTILAIEKSAPIYSQQRIGKSGRPFTLYKFRTMEIDAEKDGPKWAEARDPRVTKIGRWLRHTHLDELPQLWNILRGEMSFIGPRPERPEMLSMLEVQIPFFGLRHLVPPGVSGWAQINYPYGSSVEDARRKLEYDLYYVKHWSLFWDIRIALKTLAMVVNGEGWKKKEILNRE